MANIESKAEQSPEHQFGESEKLFDGSLHNKEINSDKSFVCPNKPCLYRTRFRQAFDRHIKTVHSKPRLYCEVCGKGFPDEGRIKMHKFKAHGYPNPYRCKTCDQSFPDKYSVERHEQSHDPTSRRFRCQLCPKSYTTKYGLRDHQKAQHMHQLSKQEALAMDDSMSYEEKVLESSLAAEKIEPKQKESFQCEKCKFSTFFKNSLRRHIRNWHKMKQCPACAVSVEKVKIEDHMREKHPELQCKICGKIWTTFLQARVHGEKCGVKASHECEHCHRVFTSESNLRLHILRMHFVDARRFSCVTCLRKFVIMSDLKRHSGACARHAAARAANAHVCTKCDRSFLSEARLAVHARIHVKTELGLFGLALRQHTLRMQQLRSGLNLKKTEPTSPKQHTWINVRKMESRERKCLRRRVNENEDSEMKDDETIDVDVDSADQDFSVDSNDKKDTMVPPNSKATSDGRDPIEETGNNLKEDSLNLSMKEQHQFDLAQKAYVLARHNGEMWLRCLLCAFKAKAKGQILMHIRRHHPEIRKWRWQQWKLHLVQLRKKWNANEEWSCGVCDFKSVHFGSWIRHMNDIHKSVLEVERYPRPPPGIDQCNYCDYRSGIPSNLRRHTKRKHLQNFKEKPGPNEDGKWPCDQCDRLFAYKRSLDRHATEVHSKETLRKEFVSTKCGCSFTRKEYLEKHENSGCKLFISQCKFCFKRYQYKYLLNLHVKNVHNKEDLEENASFQVRTGVKCKFCAQKFRTKILRRIHEKLKHESEFKLQCSHCLLTFARLSEMDKHIVKNHTEQ